jgi:hypothetical protein
VCRPKECGGLGILNTKKMNVALLLKWIGRLYHEEDAMWVQILRAKYPEASDIFAGNGQGGSQFWKSLHKIKHLFKLGAQHTVVDGRRTLFWLDNWHHLGVLNDAFPALFCGRLPDSCLGATGRRLTSHNFTLWFLLCWDATSVPLGPFSQHNPEPFGALETSLQLSLKSFVISLILFIKSRYSCSCGS